MTQLTTSDVSLVLVLSDSGDTGDGVIPTTSFKLQLALACLNIHAASVQWQRMRLTHNGNML